ncbi:MgtC/SapB family protein [Ruthenibacterium lactatiformans]|uniref:MgtC/SapB family protein n=1 Tax=Ruthenibacterium lactatiformans TaxID=1550024 RepID=UPI0019685A7F|nr:MgtC/SapB family protein [Ruthenibacterium lactatiformans]MBN3010049.1 MgtC/SapB family protein [Ruthenibacterium lactatiformans]
MLLDTFHLLGQESWLTALCRVFLAMLMGGALGLERSRKLRPAGLRTYMLVCIGSCAIMTVGIYLFERYESGVDPVRMAAQVVSGIGFIGAGTIMVTPRHRVKGLTTAAGIWASACLGITIGAGYYVLSFGTFVLLLFTMIFADKLELNYYKRLKRLSIGLIIASLDVIKKISSHLEKRGIELTSVELADSSERRGVELSCVLRMQHRVAHQEIIQEIMSVDGVYFVERLDL